MGYAAQPADVAIAQDARDHHRRDRRPARDRFGLSFAINRISVRLATVLFLIYSATVGVTFAFIFELYTTLSGEEAGRAAIVGALALYLDFINLFLFLLRIFGQQR